MLRHREGDHPVGLFLDEKGHPRLDLFDRSTKSGISLAIESQGNPAMRFIDTGGIIRTSLAVDASKNISMELFDDKGHPRATIGSTIVKNEQSGAQEILPPSTFLLYDEDGKVVFSAPKSRGG